MMLGYARGRKMNQQLDRLEGHGIEELFSDEAKDHSVLVDETSEYHNLLNFAESGDKVVIASLEVISRDYQRLLLFLEDLKKLELELIVLNLPIMTLPEWQQFFSWVIRNERLTHPRVIRIGKEKQRNKNSYSVFSKEPEAKRLYREVMWQLLEKKKLRKIAEEKGIPIESVYRIQQEFKKIKLAIILSICFLLAIGTIKIAENFSDNFWIQFGICIITTLIILYNTLSDSGEI